MLKPALKFSHFFLFTKLWQLKNSLIMSKFHISQHYWTKNKTNTTTTEGSSAASKPSCRCTVTSCWDYFYNIRLITGELCWCPTFLSPRIFCLCLCCCCWMETQLPKTNLQCTIKSFGIQTHTPLMLTLWWPAGSIHWSVIHSMHSLFHVWDIQNV